MHVVISGVTTTRVVKVYIANKLIRGGNYGLINNQTELTKQNPII